jgi:hypothetical protein
MKIIPLIGVSICSLILLTGCDTSTCRDCGYYDYPSQCGLASCTDNTYIQEYSNPCPGPYDCPADYR